MNSIDHTEQSIPSLPYPWHLQLWMKLNQAWLSNRLPHALLLQGATGLGKMQLAEWISHAILCETKKNYLKPCGECSSCKLNCAKVHPDLLIIRPEEDKQHISVDQIRAMNDELNLTSTRNGYRVAIVEPAHQMTIAAANSLLKTLEEPNKNTLIILVTAQLGSLLPTIRSRCQKVAVSIPTVNEAQSWIEKNTGRTAPLELLSYVGGSPILAKEYLNGSYESLRDSMMEGVTSLTSGSADLTQLAQSWSDQQLPDRLRWLDFWLSKKIRQEVANSEYPSGYNEAYAYNQKPSVFLMYRTLDKLREMISQLQRTSLQRELLLVSFLMRLQQSLNSRA